MVICLKRGADLHMAPLMPLPLTVSCFSKIQTGITFLVPAHPGSPGQRATKPVCVCVVTCHVQQQQGTITVCGHAGKTQKLAEIHSASQSVAYLCRHSAFVALANWRYINVLNNNNNFAQFNRSRLFLRRANGQCATVPIFQ